MKSIRFLSLAILGVLSACALGPAEPPENGYGTYVDVNGSVYSGEFRNGKFNGHGVLKYLNGDRAEGEFSNDEIKTGYQIRSDKSRFDGEFRQYKPYKGKLVDPDKYIYEGIFGANGAFTGTLTEPSGKSCQIDQKSSKDYPGCP